MFKLRLEKFNLETGTIKIFNNLFLLIIQKYQL